VKYRELVIRIEADGWRLERVAGSHQQYRHPLKPGTVTIPAGGKLGKDVPPGTLNSILRQAGLNEVVMEYAVIIERADDGSYSAYVPDLPGCVACGDTPEEVETSIAEAIDLHLESLRYHQERIPEALTRVVTVVTKEGAEKSVASATPSTAPSPYSDYVGCPDVMDADAFAARVHGNSMVPEYREGDIVIFSPKATVRDGDDCFVRLTSGDTTFKQVFQETSAEGTATVRLQPRNPSKPPQVIPASQVVGMYRAVYKYTAVSGQGDEAQKEADALAHRIRESRRIRLWETLSQR
jgi:predicted RNase H-like HicB family nuclease/predicted RNA binding protein YcfA (HicA-like mRNA interferase family)